MAVFPQSTLRKLAVFAGIGLMTAGCSSGSNQSTFHNPILRVSVTQSPPAQTDRVVYFDQIAVAGDSISMNVVVSDTTGNLQIDDADLAFRYDASFIQVSAVGGQNTLFGTCNTLNLACGVNSPICVNNQTAANGGGEKFCRGNGSTFCTKDSDCPAAGDACGSFGRLEAAFAVLAGPKICSNDGNRNCTQSSDCQFCTNNPLASCTVPTDCRFCSNSPTTPCTSPADCGGASCDVGTCSIGNCSGCPAVVVSGKQLLATLSLRVMREGIGDFRFVVSSSGQSPASFLRNGTTELSNVLFTPNVDATNLSVKDDQAVLMIHGSL